MDRNIEIRAFTSSFCNPEIPALQDVLAQTSVSDLGSKGKYQVQHTLYFAEVDDSSTHLDWVESCIGVGWLCRLEQSLLVGNNLFYVKMDWLYCPSILSGPDPRVFNLTEWYPLHCVRHSSRFLLQVPKIQISKIAKLWDYRENSLTLWS